MVLVESKSLRKNDGPLFLLSVKFLYSFITSSLSQKDANATIAIKIKAKTVESKFIK